MKNLFATLAIVVMGTTASLPVLAATPVMEPSAASIQSRVAQIQANVTSFQTQVAAYKSETRYESDLQWVMKANGITRAEAILRKDRAHFSQSGLLGKSPLSPFERFVFNPATGAWGTIGASAFYAGWNQLTGTHVLTTVKRAEVRADNFWYCPTGQTYVYTDTVSTCVNL